MRTRIASLLAGIALALSVAAPTLAYTCTITVTDTRGAGSHLTFSFVSPTDRTHTFAAGPYTRTTTC